MPTSFPDAPEAGFSLLEMLVVLAILALAAGLVVGRMGHGAPGLRQEARLTESWLRDQRSAAMARAGFVQIRTSDAGLVAAAFGGAPLSRRDLRGQVVMAAPVIFRPDGSTNGGHITVRAAGGQGYALQVAPLTGQIITELDTGATP